MASRTIPLGALLLTATACSTDPSAAVGGPGGTGASSVSSGAGGSGTTTSSGVGGGGSGASGGGGGSTGPVCGNDAKETGEACDGADLGGASCASAVAAGWVGVLGCEASCAELDAASCQTPPTTYHDVNNIGLWQQFDLETPSIDVKGFRGAVFDGRHVYLVPLWENSASTYHGNVVRYDTLGAFSVASSWQKIDLEAEIDPGAKGFFGGAFDGRHVYFVPTSDAAGQHGRIARYDTLGAFDSPTAWGTYDIEQAHPGAKGFFGAVFDGRYVYLVPGWDGAIQHGRAIRYDTLGAFDAPGAWRMFDIESSYPGATGFFGGVFDGRYVYYAPRQNTPFGYNGRVVRHDTQGAGYELSSAWDMFDAESDFNAGAKGFLGMVFDGRYVYLVPYQDGAGTHGRVVRYDTVGDPDFDLVTHWQMFDLETAFAGAKGFVAGGFDGRYVYLTPYKDDVGNHGRLVRYDTLAAFDVPGSWQTFDVETAFPGAKGFAGTIFDGRYLYLGPHYDGVEEVIVRFDAKTPPWLPKGWNSSFF